MHFNCKNLNETVLLQSLTTSCMLAVYMGTNKFQQYVRGLFEYERHQFFLLTLYGISIILLQMSLTKSCGIFAGIFTMKQHWNYPVHKICENTVFSICIQYISASITLNGNYNNAIMWPVMSNASRLSGAHAIRNFLISYHGFLFTSNVKLINAQFYTSVYIITCLVILAIILS